MRISRTPCGPLRFSECHGDQLSSVGLKWRESLGLSGSNWGSGNSVGLSGSHLGSVVLNGDHWDSVVVIVAQWGSVEINGGQLRIIGGN